VVTIPSIKRRVVDKSVKFDAGDIDFAEILPIADLHIGDKTVGDEPMNRVIRWVNAKKNRYIMIAGDVFNAAIKSSVSDCYSEKYTLDEAADIFTKIVEKIGADKIVAVVRGNHDNRVNRAVSIDPVEWACKRVGVRYCGAEAYIRFGVGNYNGDNKKRSPMNYSMFMTHGVGGGKMMGGKINGMMRLRNIVIADIYVQGHTHTPSIVPSVISEFGQSGEIVERDQLFVTTPGFTSRDGYAKDYCFPGASTLFPVIQVSGRRKRMTAYLTDLSLKNGV
jgi:predicted phosphodiesterase